MADTSIDVMMVCRKCGLEKPFDCDNFINENKKLANLCRECRRADCKSYYAANREKILQGFKESRKRDPEFHRARDAEYYRKHIEKKKERCQQYRKANPDRVREWHREWRKKNPERLAAYGVAHRAKFKEKIGARIKRWMQENKERVLENRRRYYHADAERWRKYHREHRSQRRERYNELARLQYRKHRHKTKVWSHKRRIANGSGICFSGDDIARIFREQSGVCRYCDHNIANYYEVDHFIPIKRGGGHEPENIVLACKPCNRSKGAKLPWVWRPDLFT